MTAKLGGHSRAGKALSDDEREIVALALQDADRSDQSEIDEAWGVEIDRRVEEIHTGRVGLVDGEETLRMARVRLAPRAE